jgi:hypothetical protein
VMQSSESKCLNWFTDGLFMVWLMFIWNFLKNPNALMIRWFVFCSIFIPLLPWCDLKWWWWLNGCSYVFHDRMLWTHVKFTNIYWEDSAQQSCKLKLLNFRELLVTTILNSWK